MPPKKESAGARKAREKAERFAAAQFQERLDAELEEERGRSQVELLERLARAEAGLQFFETMASPAARLMVPKTTYDAMRSKMQNEGAVSAQRLLAMQVELRRVEKGGAQLQHELAHLRGEVRGVVSTAHQSLLATRRQVDTRLGDYIEALDGAVAHQRTDAESCAAALNKALLESRRVHIDQAVNAQRRAQEVTELWREATSMHTRIPPRIRRTLQGLEKDDLLRILDTLSFETVVQRYLLYRFSPGPDDPFSEGAAQILAAAPPADGSEDS
jgi:hypothetical protein